MKASTQIKPVLPALQSKKEKSNNHVNKEISDRKLLQRMIQ